MAIIAFPSILNERLTDAGAQALVDIFDKVEQDSQKTTLGIAEERFERRMTQLDAKIDGVRADVMLVKSELEAKIDGVRADVMLVKSELEAKIDGVETRLEAKIDGVEARLEVKIDAKTERVRADIIKWMFIFWVGQIGTITAILFTFFRDVPK